MYSKISYLISLIIIASTLSFNAFGQRTFRSVNSGRFELGSSWSQTAGPFIAGIQIPGPNDTAIIVSNHFITARFDQDLAKLVFNGNSCALQVGNINRLVNLNVFGDVVFVNPLAHRFFVVQGKIRVDGDVLFTSNRSLLFLEARNGFLPREIELKGEVTNQVGVPTSIGQIFENPENPNTFTSTTRLTGTGNQNLTFTSGNNKNIHNDIIVDKPSGNLTFTNDFNNNTMKGQLSVVNGEVNFGNSNITTLNGMENQLDFAPGTALKIENNPNGLPTQSDASNSGTVLNMQPGTTTEVMVSENQTQMIAQPNPSFNVFLSDLNVSGRGTKVLNANVGTGINLFGINDINVNSGTLQINSNVTDISGVTGTITVKDGARLLILGNPLLPDASQFVFEPGSIVEYRSNAAQSILGNVNFADIIFSGTGVKTTSAPFSFQGEMGFNNNGTLNINHDITINSDINRTGFVSAIPNGYNINYNGGARFIAERFLITSPLDLFNANENFRDFSLPVSDAQALLSQFDDDNPFPAPPGTYPNGFPELPIFNVPNSNYPPANANSKASVNFWNSTTGAFERPADYNATIVRTNGLGAITSNAVRFGWADDDGQTLIVRGQINRGTKTFNATFNAVSDFNLYGNPYPCALDFEAIVAGNANINNSGTGIIPTVYMVAPDQVGTGTLYTFYNAVTNVGTATDGIIPAYQGFFLQTTAAAPASFNFNITENMKEAVDQVTFKSRNVDAPDLFDISLSKNNAMLDRIHFYFFEDATNGFDKILDVEKLEASALAYTGATVDFYDGKKKLNVLANAISKNSNNLNLSFIVSNPNSAPSASDLSLDLSGLTALFKDFNCVYIENKTTGETYDITGNFLSITVPGNAAETEFALVSLKAPDLFKINTVDATCFGFEDGILRVDMSNIPANSPVRLFKDQKLFDSFASTNNVYKRSVGAGNYEFKINGITATCTYSYSTSIDESPEVIADFVLPDSLFMGRDLVFKSTSSNATGIEWFGPDAKTTLGDSVVYNFNQVGEYFLKLTAIGDYSTCTDEKLKYFYIDSVPNTAVGINNAFSNALSENLKVLTGKESLSLSGLPSGVKVNLFNELGQRIKSSDESNGIVTFAGLKIGVYIVEITLNNDRYSTKVAVH